MITPKPAYYRIYLLTVWQEATRGPPSTITWRFRLEDPRSGQQWVLADIASFIAALQALATTEEVQEKEE